MRSFAELENALVALAASLPALHHRHGTNRTIEEIDRDLFSLKSELGQGGPATPQPLRTEPKAIEVDSGSVPAPLVQLAPAEQRDFSEYLVDSEIPEFAETEPPTQVHSSAIASMFSAPAEGPSLIDFGSVSGMVSSLSPPQVDQRQRSHQLGLEGQHEGKPVAQALVSSEESNLEQSSLSDRPTPAPDARNRGAGSSAELETAEIDWVTDDDE